MAPELARCLPRGGERGAVKLEVREEKEALDRGRLLVGALDAGAVLGRAGCCCRWGCRWGWEGKGGGCLLRGEEGGMAKLEVREETDALD